MGRGAVGPEDVRVDAAVVEEVVRLLLSAARLLDPTALAAAPVGAGRLRELPLGRALGEVHEQARDESVRTASSWARSLGTTAAGLMGSVGDLESGEAWTSRQFRAASRRAPGGVDRA